MSRTNIASNLIRKAAGFQAALQPLRGKEGGRPVARKKQAAYTFKRTERRLVLVRLRMGPCTLELLRDQCRVPDPGARINELRQQGWRIDAHTSTMPAPDGLPSSVTFYVLHPEDGKRLPD